MTINSSTFYRPADPEMRKIRAIQTLARWRHEGRGPRYTKSGSLVLYKGEDILEWLETKAVETNA